MADSLLSGKQKTALLLAAFLPVACILWGQLGSYLAHPHAVSASHVVLTIFMLLVLGPLIVAIFLSLFTFAYIFMKQQHEGLVTIILVLAHVGMIPWALSVGRNAIF